MTIELIRSIFNGDNTIGRMLINGKFFAHTLEDVYRVINKPEDKVYGKTAIPYGIYKVSVTYSNAFKKPLPLLHNVPYFEGIRIHGGNTDADTFGCILIGANTDEKKIWNCGGKVSQLTRMIQESTEPVIIEIKPEFKNV